MKGAIARAAQMGRIANHVGTPLVVAALLVGVAAAMLRRTIPEYLKDSVAPAVYLGRLMSTEMLPLRRERYPVIAAAELLNWQQDLGLGCAEALADAERPQVCDEMAALHSAFLAALKPINSVGLADWLRRPPRPDDAGAPALDRAHEQRQSEAVAEQAAAALRRYYGPPQPDSDRFWVRWQQRMKEFLLYPKPVEIVPCAQGIPDEAQNRSFLAHERQFGPAGCFPARNVLANTVGMIPSMLNIGWQDVGVEPDCEARSDGVRFRRCFSPRVQAAVEVSEILEILAEALKVGEKTALVSAYVVTPDGVIREWARNFRSIYSEIGPSFIWNYGDYFRRFLRDPGLKTTQTTVPYFDLSGYGLVRTQCTPLYVKLATTRGNVPPASDAQRDAGDAPFDTPAAGDGAPGQPAGGAEPPSRRTESVLLGAFCTDYKLALARASARKEDVAKIYEALEISYEVDSSRVVRNVKLIGGDREKFFRGLVVESDVIRSDELSRLAIAQALGAGGHHGELRPITIDGSSVFVIPQDRLLLSEGPEVHRWRARLVRPVVLQASLEPFIVPGAAIALAFVFVFWAAASAHAKSRVHREEAILRNLQVAVYAAAPSKTCEGANDRAEELFGRWLPTLGLSPSLREHAVPFVDFIDRWIAVEAPGGRYQIRDLKVVERWRRGRAGPDYYFVRRKIAVKTSSEARAHDDRWLRIRGTKLIGGEGQIVGRARSFCIALPVDRQAGAALERALAQHLARQREA